jgi:hypothetical protein
MGKNLKFGLKRTNLLEGEQACELKRGEGYGRKLGCQTGNASAFLQIACSRCLCWIPSTSSSHESMDLVYGMPACLPTPSSVDDAIPRTSVHQHIHT